MGFHKTFSSRDVVINYAGMDITGGKGETNFLTISRNAERVNIRQGLDGKASIAVKSDHTITVTYTVFPETQTAETLMGIDEALRNAERSGVIISGELPFTVTDPSGVILLAATNAVLIGYGDQSFGENTGEVEFTFHLQDVVKLNLNLDIASEINSKIAGANLPTI